MDAATKTQRFIAQLGVRQHKMGKASDAMQSVYIVGKGLGHGGYDFFLVTSDGGLLCRDCVRENFRSIVESTRGHEGDTTFSDGWQADGFSHSGEFDLEPEYCSHCSKLVHEGESDSDAFVRCVDANLKDMTVSVGCRGEECEHADGDADHSCESSFSWSDCDSCGTTLGGDRSPATGLWKLPSGELETCEMSLCTDCAMYHANGDVPETWEQHS